MKKYFVAVLSFLVAATCLTFTACKPRKLQNGVLLTDRAGGRYPAATDENGRVERDENGNIILLATNDRGENVRDENGEYKTEAVKPDHALIVGNRIECRDFAVKIPSGWSENGSFTELSIKRNDSEDRIKISTRREATETEIIRKYSQIINAVKASYPDASTLNGSLTVKGAEASFLSAFIPDQGNGRAAYQGFVTFSHEGVVFTCMLISDRDMGKFTDEIVEILDAIEFK